MKPTRGETDVLVVTSLSALEHIAQHRPERLVRLTVSKGGERGNRAARLAQIASANGVKVDFDRLPQEGGGAKGWLKKFEYTEWDELLPRLQKQKRAAVLGLDHIQDPQNFGAICRSAEALGAQAIILPRERSVSVTPAVYQASVGAVETVPIVRVANLKDAVRKLKEVGFWSAATTLAEDSQPLSQMPDFEKLFFILGAEGDGISQTLADECDVRIRIAMPGKIESLNVSVSAAVLLYEFLRRQG